MPSSSFFQEGATPPASYNAPPPNTPTSTNDSSSLYQDSFPTPNGVEDLYALYNNTLALNNSIASNAAAAAAEASLANSEAAAASASAAATSATNSATSASNSAASATSSANSASTSTTEANAAAASASAASTSATNAASSASAASTSATNAGSSATAAAASASAASTSATNAAASASAASTQATNAASSASAASSSASSASTSATNAANSASAAATSASNAASTLSSSLLKANNLSDLSNVSTARTNLGLVASATTDTTNASNISSGTLPAARLPAPTTSALGGVKSATAGSNQFCTGINTSGVPTFAQPTASNISGLATSATTDTTNASNISSGTLNTARMGSGTANSTTFLRGDNTWQTVSSGSTPGGGLVNKFRNGVMDVAQRGTSGSVASGSTAYTLDGWQIVATGAAAAWSQVYNANLTGNALRISCASGLTGCTLQQRIESYLASELLAYNKTAQAVTIQLAIYNNTGATITPQIAAGYASAQDNFGTVTSNLAATNLQSIPNGSSAIVAYTYTPSVNIVNGMQVALSFGGALNAASGYVDISFADIRATPGVATGLNSSPPTPEIRNIQSESELCYRYYFAANSSFSVKAFSTGSGGNGACMWYLPYAMRTTSPTMSGMSWSSLTNCTGNSIVLGTDGRTITSGITSTGSYGFSGNLNIGTFSAEL